MYTHQPAISLSFSVNPNHGHQPLPMIHPWFTHQVLPQGERSCHGFNLFRPWGRIRMEDFTLKTGWNFKNGGHQIRICTYVYIYIFICVKLIYIYIWHVWWHVWWYQLILMGNREGKFILLQSRRWQAHRGGWHPDRLGPDSLFLPALGWRGVSVLRDWNRLNIGPIPSSFLTIITNSISINFRIHERLINMILTTNNTLKVTISTPQWYQCWPPSNSLTTDLAKWGLGDSQSTSWGGWKFAHAI